MQPPRRPAAPAAANKDEEDAGVLEPGKTKPPPAAGSSAESGWEPPAEVNLNGASGGRLKGIDSADASQESNRRSATRSSSKTLTMHSIERASTRAGPNGLCMVHPPRWG